MADFILEVKNLVKYYGKYKAVDNLSFAVPKGKVVGLLGPNGAGKTTTIQMLLGITTPSSGEIKYFNKDFQKNRQYCLQRINFASAFNTLNGRISVWENLVVFSHLYSIKNPKQKILDLLAHFEIKDLLNEKYWDLSTGQKTRVNLVKSLLNDPELILMDEPTASLDPDIADKTLSLIEELKESQNLSLLFTSHNMDEVTRVCDEVIFIDHGKIVAQDTPLGLTKRIESATLQITFDNDQKITEDFLKAEEQSFKFKGRNVVLIKTTEKEIPGLIFKMGKVGIWIIDIEVKKPTLEDVFLTIARGESHVV